jgi:hypothetical protein
MTRQALRKWAVAQGLTVWVGAHQRSYYSAFVDAIRLRWRPGKGFRSRAFLFEAEDGRIRFTNADRLHIANCIAGLTSCEPPEVTA